MKYDFIADVHGYADQLEALLQKLGYQNRNGAYRHSDPARMAISVGDLMDRGPRQFDSLDIFRRMRDAGTGLAIMGNHEHSAIGFYHEDPKNPGAYLRPHIDKNLHQHQVFLDQISDDTALYRELIEWMMTMPLFLEGPAWHAVHACWHPQSINQLKEYTDLNGVLSSDDLLFSFDKDCPYYDATEIVMKGLEMDLPNGVSFKDAQGRVRHKSRLRWWHGAAAHYRTSVIMEEGMTCEHFPDELLPENSIVRLGSSFPVFFGHYWLSGEPQLMTEKRACLDFSVAAGGPLVAYAWDGEQELTPEHLVSVR